MSRQTTAEAARPQAGGNGGKQWTDAEKAEYERQQARAFRNFTRYFAGQANPKTRIPFLAKVIEMSEESHQHTDNFGTRQTSTVKVELVDPPVAGIRFQTEVTDNPNTIKNPDSALNHLYAAATGTTPPSGEGVFSWDTRDILHESAGGTGRLVMAIIQRGGDRDDGKRGGLWSELKDFTPHIPAPTFEEEEAEVPVAQALFKPAPRKRAKAPVQEADPELDEVPF